MFISERSTNFLKCKCGSNGYKVRNRARSASIMMKMCSLRPIEPVNWISFFIWNHKQICSFEKIQYPLNTIKKQFFKTKLIYFHLIDNNWLIFKNWKRSNETKRKSFSFHRKIPKSWNLNLLIKLFFVFEIFFL